MRFTIIIGAFFILAGCFSEPNISIDNLLEVPHEIIVAYEQNPIPFPFMIEDATTLSETSGFNEDICVIVNTALIHEIDPELDTYRFIQNITNIYVDWELQGNLAFYPPLGNLNGSNSGGPVYVCFNTTGLDTGSHLAFIELQLNADTKIIHVWTFMIE